LELSALRFAEVMAEERVRGAGARGNAACMRVCREAGAATSRAMAAVGLAGLPPVTDPAAG
jgi:hypothetical protein